MTRQQAIGIDLGGTHVKGVLIGSAGETFASMTAKTHTNGKAESWKQTVKEMVQSLREKAEEKTVIGISAPGLASATADRIDFMPGRLDGLEGFDWGDYLKEPVRVLNDAHAAILAESAFGAGRGYQNLAMLTLGTGVGGGLLLNGQVFAGFRGIAGHIGHMSVDADNEQRDITNVPGSLEDAIGDATVGQRTYGKFSSTQELVMAYEKGDPLATYFWLHSVKKLAVGIASLCNIISPEAIVLGGGIARAGISLLDPLQAFLALYEWRPGGKKATLLPATFDEYAGALGAAAFAMKK